MLQQQIEMGRNSRERGGNAVTVGERNGTMEKKVGDWWIQWWVCIALVRCWWHHGIYI